MTPLTTAAPLPQVQTQPNPAQLAQAYRTGRLSPVQAAHYEEAVRRGLVNDPYAVGRIEERANPWGRVQGGLETFNRAVPGFSELSALGPAAGAAVQDALAGRRGPNDGFAADWNQVRARQQGMIDQNAQDRPFVSGLERGAGYALQAAPAFMTGGSSVAPQVAATTARGLAPAVLRAAPQVARNAVTGATVAGINAFAQPGAFAQRSRNAANAFGPGAVLGAALPAAAGAAGDAARRLAGAVGRPAPLDIEGFNRFIGNLALGHIGETAPQGLAAGAPLTQHLADRFDAADKANADSIDWCMPDHLFEEALLHHRASLADVPAARDWFHDITDEHLLYPILDGSETGDEVGQALKDLRGFIDQTPRTTGVGVRMFGALNGMREALIDQAERQNPGFAQTQRSIDAGRAILSRMVQASGDSGEAFTPTQLKSVIGAPDDPVARQALPPADALLYDVADRAERAGGAAPQDAASAQAPPASVAGAAVSPDAPGQ